MHVMLRHRIMMPALSSYSDGWFATVNRVVLVSWKNWLEKENVTHYHAIADCTETLGYVTVAVISKNRKGELGLRTRLRLQMRCVCSKCTIYDLGLEFLAR